MSRMIDDELFNEIHGILAAHNYFTEAEEFRSAPSVELLDLNRLDIHSKQTCPVEDFVYVSDLHSLVIPGQWIATGDRLPNDNARMLAYTRARGRIVASFYNGHWFDEGSLERDVTHWQPLSPPPKEPQ